MSNLKLSIVIPAFNEEMVINKLLTELNESFKDISNYEIIIIDDGSDLPLFENVESELIKDNLKIIRNNFNGPINHRNKNIFSN